ncbi:MAG: hypothetical protein ABR507_01255 [Actinomycetota bacterium]|nr:hypothetical protein [Actinomycetota bacterium]
MSDAIRIGAYALVHADETELFLAEDEPTIARVLALELIARTPAQDISSDQRLQKLRALLADEQWAEALHLWIEETGVAVDIYAEEPQVWTTSDERIRTLAWEIRSSPLFVE